ncbi:hypothetical protein DFH06DRAFT_1131395 [Mycena polygramma]|nr:hypothetical protein DFH06DRAFT_1131395 [Mycena polygramma]
MSVSSKNVPNSIRKVKVANLQNFTFELFSKKVEVPNFTKSGLVLPQNIIGDIADVWLCCSSDGISDPMHHSPWMSFPPIHTANGVTEKLHKQYMMVMRRSAGSGLSEEPGLTIFGSLTFLGNRAHFLEKHTFFEEIIKVHFDRHTGAWICWKRIDRREDEVERTGLQLQNIGHDLEVEWGKKRVHLPRTTRPGSNRFPACNRQRRNAAFNAADVKYDSPGIEPVPCVQSASIGTIEGRINRWDDALKRKWRIPSWNRLPRDLEVSCLLVGSSSGEYRSYFCVEFKKMRAVTKDDSTRNRTGSLRARFESILTGWDYEVKRNTWDCRSFLLEGLQLKPIDLGVDVKKKVHSKYHGRLDPESNRLPACNSLPVGPFQAGRLGAELTGGKMGERTIAYTELELDLREMGEVSSLLGL